MGYKPLLATSECNVAVDNIAEGLVAQLGRRGCHGCNGFLQHI